MTALCCLVAAAALAPAAVSAPAEAARLELLTLDARGVDAAEVRGELALRLPGLRITTTSRAGTTQRRAHVALRADPRDAATFQLDVVVYDGRAYKRTLRVDLSDAPRLLAVDIASLIAAIEEGEVAPDREGVPLPTKPEPEPEPEKPPPEKPTEPRVELAPLLLTGPILALGSPSAANPLTAFAGHVGLDARFPRGAIVSFGFRVAGWRVTGTSVTRFRIALGGGYAVRVRRFELPIVALGTVEPYTISRGGARFAIVGPDDTDRSPATSTATPGPVLGLALRLAPSVRFATRRRAVAVRLGLRTELALSAELTPQPRVPRYALVDPDEPGPRLRVGGVELYLGPEVGVWFGI